MSLKCMIDKWLHKGQISQEEHDAVIKKLEGHDKQIKAELLDKVAEKFISWDSKVKGIREDGVCFFTIENILKGIEDLKAEVRE